MRIFCILIFLLASINIYSDTELPVVYETNDNFSIFLPEGWIETPREILDEYTLNIQRLMPGTPRQYYNYGYQPLGNEWFVHPYILVQITKKGRIPENQLMQYRQLEEAMEKGVKQVEEKMSEFVSNTKKGEIIYESENKILWSSMSMDVEGVGTVKALVAIKLTQYGSIQFLMSSTADSFDTYKDIYRDIALNLSISPDAEYQTKIHEQFSPQVLKVLIFAAIGLIIFGIKKAFK